MWRAIVLCLCVLLSSSLAWGADKALSSSDETAAEKLRKALDSVRDLEIAGLPMDQAINQLREQTGLNVQTDRAIVSPSVPSPMLQGPLGPLGPNPAFSTQIRLQGEFHGIPLRAALTKLLRDHNLTHVLIGDTVLITTMDMAVERQLQQSVSVNVEGKSLAEELKRLGRETGANLVLDPRMAKEGKTALTLRLDEVPLETAVEVLADMAGLRAVRLKNVLYVTSEARAKALHKPPAAAVPSSIGWQVWPDGNGGFQMTPPQGVGNRGAGNIGGFGAFGGIGGFAGMGGGGFNQLGGGVVGPSVAPVPLTPPLPQAKPAPPEKPAKEAPPGKPAVQSEDKEKSSPKEKSQAQALRSRSIGVEIRGKKRIAR